MLNFFPANPVPPYASPAMRTAPTSALTALYLLCFHSLLWIALSSIAALMKVSDSLQSGQIQNPEFGSLHWFTGWWLSCVGYLVLTFSLHLLIRSRPGIFQHRFAIALGLLILLALYLPVELLYCAFLSVYDAKSGLSWTDCWHYWQKLPKFHCFTDGVIATASYASMVAFAVWSQGRQLEKAWLQTQTDNLRLQLELEQQHLLTLRAQLEPHFIFNALNSISALVRSNDKTIALRGIQKLSQLLRYAITASQREWISLYEELEFLHDYLDLQAIRYGDRLALDIATPACWMHEHMIPPLLLQPLLENCLRHGADSQSETTAISLHIEKQSEELNIILRNQFALTATPNPGLGMGLPHTHTRLSAAYGASASLQTNKSAGQFIVTLRLPVAP
ncbi:sensor histidine kinase [Undibacterium crateris]|uniref:sensor histidine kinase n=1 Tax=Undibacterium crateris TaxID=2528175 RepID=UPI001389882E|nr:sensor histidine kinase [Undibacterium crateris]NDI87295.1 sensor histidine kinase [Undibacterium crateris]